MKTIFKTLLILTLALSLSACGQNNQPPTQDEIDETVEAAEELLEEIDETYKVRGSCNLIAKSSSCLDYIGSFWTEENMKPNCAGAGAWSKNTCPYSDRGGCQTGGGTVMEAVVWSYGHGGQPISIEEAGYMAGACNAIIMSKWVTPEIFLENRNQ